MSNPADNFPLHQAAFDPMQSVSEGYDHANLTKLRGALDQGADVNATNEHGQTALHVTQSPHAARMLLDAGANPTALDNDGLLPSQARNVSTGLPTHKANGVDRIVEAAAKERNGREAGEPDVSALKGVRLSDMPRETQQAPDVAAHKDARLIDMKIPERDAQSVQKKQAQRAVDRSRSMGF